MAEVPKQDAAAAAAAPKAPEPKRNPAFKAMGLPNLKWKLPSRNWMIFLTVTGSWTAAVMYDRRQKKHTQKKWCDLVAHISQQPLKAEQMARKITVFISAAPGDGIRPSREFFKEYVKPILVAAAMDYDVIEGRKEGDVRYGTAEQIRRQRRKAGEPSTKADESDTQKIVEEMRERMQITSEPAPGGDLVLGRHTWKEYIRGLHEGWLGPIDEPSEPEPVTPELLSIHTTGEIEAEQLPQPDGENANEAQEEKKEDKPPEEKKKPYPPPAYIPTTTYNSSILPAALPSTFEPSQPIHQYHLLGFLRTPVRMWNYLNQRKLADRIGRDTAALVLAASRPYNDLDHPSSFDPVSDVGDASPATQTDTNTPTASSEQALALAEDEAAWHKSVRKAPKEGDTAERIWTAEMVLDDRIASRMRKFELDSEEAARAERIGQGSENGKAYEVRDLRKEKVKFDLAYEDD